MFASIKYVSLMGTACLSPFVSGVLVKLSLSPISDVNIHPVASRLQNYSASIATRI